MAIPQKTVSRLFAGLRGHRAKTEKTGIAQSADGVAAARHDNSGGYHIKEMNNVPSVIETLLLCSPKMVAGISGWDLCRPFFRGAFVRCVHS